MQGLPYRASEDDIVSIGLGMTSLYHLSNTHTHTFTHSHTHTCTHTRAHTHTHTHQVAFFGSESPVKEGENGVLIVRYPDGRASGDAFAIFDSEQHLEKALEKDRSSMGSRYVELFRSSLKEFETVGSPFLSVV